MLEEAENYYNEKSSDSDFMRCLLYAKALILKNRYDEVNDILNECLNIMSQRKLSFKEITKNVKNDKSDNQIDGFEEQRTFTKNTAKSAKVSSWSFFRTVLSAYATVASLFSHIGNQKSAEETYAVY